MGWRAENTAANTFSPKVFFPTEQRVINIQATKSDKVKQKREHLMMCDIRIYGCEGSKQDKHLKNNLKIMFRYVKRQW